MQPKMLEAIASLTRDGFLLGTSGNKPLGDAPINLFKTGEGDLGFKPRSYRQKLVDINGKIYTNDDFLEDQRQAFLNVLVVVANQVGYSSSKILNGSNPLVVLTDISIFLNEKKDKEHRDAMARDN